MDSVSDLIKGGTVLNDKIGSVPADKEEVVVDENKANSIRINKNKKNAEF